MVRAELHQQRCCPPPEGVDPTPEHSPETAAHSAVALPHHTGADHTGVVGPGAPGCTGQPAGCVYITGDEPGDYFGSPLTIADVDGDGRVELVVAEPAPNRGPQRTGVHVSTTLQGGVAWRLPGAHYTSDQTGALHVRAGPGPPDVPQRRRE